MLLLHVCAYRQQVIVYLEVITVFSLCAVYTQQWHQYHLKSEYTVTLFTLLTTKCLVLLLFFPFFWNEKLLAQSVLYFCESLHHTIGCCLDYITIMSL